MLATKNITHRSFAILVSPLASSFLPELTFRIAKQVLASLCNSNLHILKLQNYFSNRRCIGREHARDMSR